MSDNSFRIQSEENLHATLPR